MSIITKNFHVNKKLESLISNTKKIQFVVYWSKDAS